MEPVKDGCSVAIKGKAAQNVCAKSRALYKSEPEAVQSVVLARR